MSFDGRPIGGRPAHALVDRGIRWCPEGRRIFPSLTVEENLLVGAYRGAAGPLDARARLRALPASSAERRRQPGTNLSGGEQQMLAIGRALMANPRLLLLDEISLGLAPVGGQAALRRAGDRHAPRARRSLRRRAGRQPGAGASPSASTASSRARLAARAPPAELTREQIAAAYFGV